MSTKFFSDGDVHAYFNPYETPYEAFMNYMNVLSDFTLRLNAAVPENTIEQELATLSAVLGKKEEKLEKLEAELMRIRATKAKTKTPSKTKKTKTTTKTKPKVTSKTKTTSKKR